MKKLITLLKNAAVSFAMYSNIPTPHFNWDEDNRKYALCFFPLVGIVVSAFALIVWTLGKQFDLDPVLSAVLLTLVPLVTTGGLHWDGLIDTLDALSSHQNTEKKLSILKDPHVGAFGIIGCFCLFLLEFGLLVQYFLEGSAVFLLIPYGLARTFTTCALIFLPCAKNSGLAHAFANTSAKKTVLFWMLAYSLLFLYLLTQLYRWFGLIILFLGFLSLPLFHRFTMKHFGGITGDLCGFYCITLEIFFIFTGILGGRLCSL